MIKTLRDLNELNRRTYDGRGLAPRKVRDAEIFKCMCGAIYTSQDQLNKHFNRMDGRPGYYNPFHRRVNPDTGKNIGPARP